MFISYLCWARAPVLKVSIPANLVLELRASTLLSGALFAPFDRFAEAVGGHLPTADPRPMPKSAAMDAYFTMNPLPKTM